MKRGVIVGASTILVIISLFFVSLTSSSVSADDQPGVWDGGFKAELVTENRQFKNGHPCEIRNFFTTTRILLKGKYYYSYPERESYCGLYTDYGFTDDYYYIFNGAIDKAHSIIGPTNYFKHFPNNITTVSVAAPWNTSQRVLGYYEDDFYKDIPDTYTKSSSSSPLTLRKDLTQALNSSDPFLMQYADNKRINMGQYGVSENGRFIAFVERDKKAIILHDTVFKTYKTVSRDTINTSSFGSIAVTNDGSAVLLNGTGVSSATNSSGKLAMKLYKTKGCTQTVNAQDFVSTLSFDVTGCETVDLTSQLGEVLGDNPGYWGADNAYFHPRNYYIQAAFLVQRDKDGNPTSGRKYVRFTPNNAPEERGYLAMGDSFSSGEGDGEGGEWYEPGTDEHGDEGTFLGRNLCHVSRRSYPYLLAKRLGYLQGSEQTPITPASDGDFHSVACSGAVIHNVIGGSLYGEDQGEGDSGDFKYRDNQYIYEETNFLAEWQQGVTQQLNSITGVIFASDQERDFNPEVITLGIGGNDAGFGEKVAACSMPLTCSYAIQGSEDSKNVVYEIANLKFQLTQTYKKVKREASEDARVYVHGYPVFITTRNLHQCDTNVPFDEREAEFIENTIQYMNSVVEVAAKEAGVFYVDLNEALINQELCSGIAKRLIAVNGVTAGDDINNIIFGTICMLRTGCLGNESFHPTPEGHALYADAIKAQTANLTAPMPIESPTLIPAPDDYFGAEARQNIEKMNNARINAQPLDFPVPYSNRLNISPTTRELTLQAVSQGFMPNSLVEVEVHSEPIALGSFEVDEKGMFEAELTIPNALEPGVHEIHVYGIDTFGQQIDTYSSFYVGFSSDDFDGDGIDNENDSCPTIINSGIDEDKDGIDDACDGDTIVETAVDDNEDDQGEDNDNQGDDEDGGNDEPKEKGKPNKETVAGTDKESRRNNNFQGAVLAATTDNPEVLAQTGTPTWIPVLAGASIIISGIMLRRKSKTYYVKEKTY